MVLRSLHARIYRLKMNARTLLLVISASLLVGFACGQQPSNSCTTGFTDSLSALHKARNGRQYIFPFINFMCHGYITLWSFYARYNSNSGSILYPEFQIWRINGSQYTKVAQTSISASDRMLGRLTGLSSTKFMHNEDDLYVYNVSELEPMSFQPGDVVGVHTPRSSMDPRSQLRVRFNKRDNDPPLSYFQDGNQPLSLISDLPGSEFSTESVYIPVISAEVVIFETTSFGASTAVVKKTSMISVSPSTSYNVIQSTPSTMSMPPSMPGTVNPQSSSSALSVAVAVGVIAAVVLIVSAFLVVILAVCIRKAKQKKNSYNTNTTTPTFNNPTYDTTSNGNFTNGHGFSNHSFETSANLYDYAQPVPLNHDTNGVQLTKASHDYQDPVYADPELEESCLNGIYESTSTDLQWGLYVPTLQQRSTRPLEPTQTTGSGNENDIYSFIYSKLDSSATRPTSEAFFEERDVYWNPSSNPEELYSQLSTHKYREIIRQQIKLSDVLGSGEFGTVHKGVWHSPSGPVDVAVKMLKEGAKEKNRVKFLQEAAINGQFHHPSIIKLQGVVTVGEPVMIVLELMPHGDLRSYLCGLKPSPGELSPPGLSEQCLLFCRQVCSGMRYLSSKSFVHRDLAARNILVSKNKTCKIADFGMARDIEESDYYVSHGGKVPIKWTAPEALNYKKYSSASDVWSFGALMYEIWSLGHKPFEKYSNIEIIRLVSDGFRLAPPPGCPQEVYTLMIQCWHPESSSRPTFSDLVTSFNEPDSKLLTCPSDVDPPEAVVLGAPLEMGENLYQELQTTYKSHGNQTNSNEPDYL